MSKLDKLLEKTAWLLREFREQTKDRVLDDQDYAWSAKQFLLQLGKTSFTYHEVEELVRETLPEAQRTLRAPEEQP